MASSGAKTVEAYLASLPPERSEALAAVRRVILENLGAGFEEGMWFGMIGYVIPLSRYPDTYNKQPLGLAALASQKGYMAVYLMNVYGDPELKSWFEGEYARRGKKLDMGKSCVRFKRLEDVPLDLIGEAIARTDVAGYLARHEAARGATRSSSARRAAGAKAERPAKKVATKKGTAGRTGAKKG